ncbi:MAG: hypothetical protein V1754_03740, partial [Pseudomonadota bacterium]
DGLKDGEEDTSGDGLLGCCLSECNKPDEKWQKDNCVLVEDGCGVGQECKNSLCTPIISFDCSNGETNPLRKDTFGDGKLDNERGTFICRDATEDTPQGRKAIQTQINTKGDWHVAIEKDAAYSELNLSDPGAREAAAVIEDKRPLSEVAGFVLSRNINSDNIQNELTAMIESLTENPPGGSGNGTVTVRGSGVERTTHDGFEGVHGTILDLVLSKSSSVATVRNEMVAILLGRTPSGLGTLPTPFGISATEFVLRFVTVRRFDKENPTDQSKWRLVVMGAVASKTNYQNPTSLTGFVADDLSNGTALATSSDEVMNECDVGEIAKLPIADIIWVVDESGSMDDNRQDIVNNANNFFSRAMASGLDFRMGVTNVVNPSGGYSYAVGKFCSTASTDSKNDGGEDRFLNSSEQVIFSACIKNPPGFESSLEYGLVNAKEAVLKHLPRVSGVPNKIRPEATLVIIVVTDEMPESLEYILGGYSKTSTLPVSVQSALDAALTEYVDLFSGTSTPEAAAVFHVIGGLGTSSGSAFVAHGYIGLANALGGQVADVTQQDLGSTLQVIIDDIVGAASPVILEYIPISTSLAVALDGKQLERSRTDGFDYRASANSLAFINVRLEKGSEVISSYKCWKKQNIVE